MYFTDAVEFYMQLRQQIHYVIGSASRHDLWERDYVAKQNGDSFVLAWNTDPTYLMFKHTDEWSGWLGNALHDEEDESQP